MIEKSLTAPRKKKVKGQLHKLAYITDKEAKLLQKFGGQKVMTPEKIPAYPPPGERGGPGSGAEGRSPGGGGNGGGGGGPQNRNFVSSPPPTQVRAPTVSDRVSPVQSMAMKGDISLAGKTQEEAQASVDRDNKLEQMKKAMQGRVIYREPFELPTKRKPTMVKTSGTGPFDRGQDNNVYQDKIRQAKREVEFDPNLSREEKVDRNKVLDNFVSKSTFAAEPKTYGIKNLLTDALLFGSGVGFFGKGPKVASGLYRGVKRGQQLAELVKPGITEDLLSKVKFSGNENVNRSNVRDTRDEQNTRDGQRVSTGKDAVTRSIKKYTGVQDTQKAELFKRRSMVEDILRKGSYQGRDLTSGQRNNLMNYIEQINKFLVPVQQGI